MPTKGFANGCQADKHGYIKGYRACATEIRRALNTYPESNYQEECLTFIKEIVSSELMK